MAKVWILKISTDFSNQQVHFEFQKFTSKFKTIGSKILKTTCVNLAYPPITITSWSAHASRIWLWNKNDVNELRPKVKHGLSQNFQCSILLDPRGSICCSLLDFQQFADWEYSWDDFSTWCQEVDRSFKSIAYEMNLIISKQVEQTKKEKRKGRLSKIPAKRHQVTKTSHCRTHRPTVKGQKRSDSPTFTAMRPDHRSTSGLMKRAGKSSVARTISRSLDTFQACAVACNKPHSTFVSWGFIVRTLATEPPPDIKLGVLRFGQGFRELLCRAWRQALRWKGQICNRGRSLGWNWEWFFGFEALMNSRNLVTDRLWWNF